MKKSLLIVLLIVLLCLIQIYSFVKIGELKSDVDELNNQLSNIQERIYRNINEINKNVDEKLEAYTSILTSAHFELGEFNTVTYQLPITFIIQPKNLTDSTTAYLKFGDEKIKMEKQDTEFILTKEFSIMDQVNPMIILENKGVQEFEENENLKLFSIKDSVFSSLSFHFSGETSYNHQEPYDFSMRGEIVSSSMIQNENEFKEIKFVISMNDEVLKSYVGDTKGLFISVDAKFEVKKGEKLIGKVVAMDQLNFIHEFTLLEYTAGDSFDGITFETHQKILSHNGIVLFESNE